jgi:hypothetical protein
MKTPRLPANDTQTGAPTRPICVPRPARSSRSQSAAPTPKESAPPKPRLVSTTSSPPPAPRRNASSAPKAGPPPLPSKTPPPLPEPALLADTDVIDDEDTVQAARTPQPSSEDVDLDCFTCSEPPPESRPRRKRAWFVGVTGFLLVAMVGMLVLARPVAFNAVRASSANGQAARAPVMLATTPPPPPVAATAAEKPSNASPVGASAGSRAKLTTHAKGSHTMPISAKKPSKRGAPKRTLAR